MVFRNATQWIVMITQINNNDLYLLCNFHDLCTRQAMAQIISRKGVNYKFLKLGCTQSIEVSRITKIRRQKSI